MRPLSHRRAALLSAIIAAAAARTVHAQYAYNGDFAGNGRFATEGFGPATSANPYFHAFGQGLEMTGSGGFAGSQFPRLGAPLVPLLSPPTASASFTGPPGGQFGFGSYTTGFFSTAMASGLTGSGVVIDANANNLTASVVVAHARASFSNFGPTGSYPVSLRIAFASVMPPNSAIEIGLVGSAYSVNADGSVNSNATGFITSAAKAGGVPAPFISGNGINGVNPDDSIVAGNLRDQVFTTFGAFGSGGGAMLNFTIDVQSGGSITFDQTLTIAADPAKIKLIDFGVGDVGVSGITEWQNTVADTQWSTAGNWTPNSVPAGVAADLFFSDTGLANGGDVVGMNGNRSCRSITFSHSAGGGSYVIDPFLAAYSLTVEDALGKGSIEVWTPVEETINAQVHNSNTLTLLVADPGGQLTVHGAVFAPNLVIDGGGTVTLDDPVIDDTLTVKTGQLHLDHDAGVDGGGAVVMRVNNTGVLNFGFRQHMSNLIIDAGGVAKIKSGPKKVIITKGLAIAPGGQLDIMSNDMVLDYDAPVGGLVDTVRLHLLNNRIKTSLADVNHALGYADNALLGRTSFGGVSVDGTSVLIKFTYGGDSTLDGKVNLDDLVALSTHWQQVGVWKDGDFNYNGTVNLSDLVILGNNWQQGVTTPQLSFADALASLGLPDVTVPEPSLAAILLAVPLLARRRRFWRE